MNTFSRFRGAKSKEEHNGNPLKVVVTIEQLENTRGLGKEYNNLHIKSSYKGAVCRAKPKQARLKLNNFVCVVILEVRNEIVD